MPFWQYVSNFAAAGYYETWRPNQRLAHLVIKACIGWKSGRLFLNCGIDIHLVQVAAFKMLATFGCFDNLFQELLIAARPQTFTETGQAARVDWQIMQKIFKTTKKLPIGILQKTI